LKTEVWYIGHVNFGKHEEIWLTARVSNEPDRSPWMNWKPVRFT